MQEIIDQALKIWGLSDAKAQFVAGRENQIFRVSYQPMDFALRIKRKGLRDYAELSSELDWMDELARAGLHVPRPIKCKNGNLIEEVDGHFVDLVSWLDGLPLGRSRMPLELARPIETFAQIGAEMARLHNVSDDWQEPQGFSRCDWNAGGLLGDAPLWGRFWDNPSLDAETKALFLAFRQRAFKELSELKAPDYGLIHADLVRENVILNGDKICLIDFDDGGYGYRLFDLATALIKNRFEENFEALKAAMIDGYSKHRSLDTEKLDLFMALRAVSYVGWIVPRIHEAGSVERNQRFIKDASELVSDYLGVQKISELEGV